MKSYTSIEQAKKLAEILPIESADMWYQYIGTRYEVSSEKPLYFPMVIRDSETNHDLPCWSLAALFDVLPDNITSNGGIAFELNIKKNIIEYSNHSLYLIYKSVKSDNLVDAAFEMVVWLKENEMI